RAQWVHVRVMLPAFSLSEKSEGKSAFEISSIKEMPQKECQRATRVKKTAGQAGYVDDFGAATGREACCLLIDGPARTIAGSKTSFKPASRQCCRRSSRCQQPFPLLGAVPDVPLAAPRYCQWPCLPRPCRVRAGRAVARGLGSL